MLANAMRKLQQTEGYTEASLVQWLDAFFLSRIGTAPWPIISLKWPKTGSKWLENARNRPKTPRMIASTAPKRGPKGPKMQEMLTSQYMASVKPEPRQRRRVGVVDYACDPVNICEQAARRRKETP